jgi:hypothetical protein
MNQHFASHFLQQLFLVLLEPAIRPVETHNSNEGSLEMIKVKDTADDSVWIAERVDQQSNKQVDHEGQNVGVLAVKYYGFLMHHKTVDLIECVLVEKSQHSVCPIPAQLLSCPGFV